MPFNDRIETKRLLLRPFNVKDTEAYYKINLDPEVSRYTHDGGVKTQEEIKKIFTKNLLGDYQKFGFGRFAVEMKDSGELLGFSGLKYMPDMDIVDLGYRFKQDVWGMGLATEAGFASLEFGFDTLGLQKIGGFILPENVASRRVLEKLGFIFKKQMVFDGVIAHEYLIRKENWQKESRQP